MTDLSHLSHSTVNRGTLSTRFQTMTNIPNYLGILGTPRMLGIYLGTSAGYTYPPQNRSTQSGGMALVRAEVWKQEYK